MLIELFHRYRPEEVYIAYLEERNCECDFLVCRRRSVVSAMQVSYDISKEKTLKCEIRGLVSAAEKTGCHSLLLI